MIPSVAVDSVAWISETEMVEVDRIMIDDLGITLLQMMENAGRNLARLVLDRFGPTAVWIATGSGGNGGGGLVAARHLINAGVDVAVTTARPVGDLSGAAAQQLGILQRMQARINGEPRDADLAIDAVIGYSLRGAPSGRSADLIDLVNGHKTVIALDTPSGLDVTTGDTPGSVVSADATLTLALPKSGLRSSGHVGELYLADISVPRSVTERFGSPAPDFRPGPVVRLV